MGRLLGRRARFPFDHGAGNGDPTGRNDVLILEPRLEIAQGFLDNLACGNGDGGERRVEQGGESGFAKSDDTQVTGDAEAARLRPVENPGCRQTAKAENSRRLLRALQEEVDGGGPVLERRITVHHVLGFDGDLYSIVCCPDAEVELDNGRVRRAEWAGENRDLSMPEGKKRFDRLPRRFGILGHEACKPGDPGVLSNVHSGMFVGQDR